MKFVAVTVSAVMATVVNAQVQYINGSFVCPTGSPKYAAYCAGASLASNIIIRCNGTTGQPGNCNDNLAGIAPVGVKSDALCYQTSETSGNAACSLEGTVYPEDGSTPQKIDGSSTSSAASYGSTAATTGVSSSTSVVYVTSPATTTVSSAAVVVSSPSTYSVPSAAATTPSTVNSTGNASTTAIVPPVYTGGAAGNIKSGAFVGLMIAAVAAALL